MVMSTVLEELGRRDPLDLRDWLLSDCVKRVIEVGEKQLGSLTNAAVNKNELLRVFGSEGQAHVSQILKSWLAIEEPLSRFSHISFQSLRRTQ